MGPHRPPKTPRGAKRSAELAWAPATLAAMSGAMIGRLFLLGVGLLFAAACASTPPPPEKTEPVAAPPKAPRVRPSRLPGRGQTRPGQAELDAALAAAGRGELESAVQQSEAAIAANPRLEQAYLLIGTSCALQGNDACEASAYGRGLEVLPASLPLQREMGFFLLRQGKVSEGVTRLESARASTPTPPPELIADLAVAYKIAGDLEKAHETADAAVEASATCVPCYLAQGEVAFAEKDFAAAEAAYASAAEQDPSNVEARRGQAKAAFLAGDVARSAELYASLAEQAPGDVRVRVQTGQVMMAAKRPRDAVVHLRAALELLPGEPKLLELLAAAQEAAGDKAGARATRAEAAKDGTP